MSKNWLNANLLMMSSGNFDGLDFEELASKIIDFISKKYFKKLIITVNNIPINKKKNKLIGNILSLV